MYALEMTNTSMYILKLGNTSMFVLGLSNTSVYFKTEHTSMYILRLSNTSMHVLGINNISMYILEVSKDVGKLFKGVADYLGVFKDPKSPYLFNISSDSIIFDRDIGQRFSEKLSQKCAPFFGNSLYMSQTALDVSENSTKGAGPVIKELVQ